MNRYKFAGSFILIFCGLVCFSHPLKAQKTYFVDGYHGGIWGHFPYHYASFIAGQLEAHPDWKVNLEIEPVTWDSIREKDPQGYDYIKAALADTSTQARVEYVNPAYGQSYLFNISGESIIRQFQYGIKTLNRHFPGLRITAYSSEEPCFTSALPGILRSFGFKYASLKNPNTCWGGYVAGHKGGVVNWVGPDGRKILTVPRYQSEKLEKGSTWQTTAWRNSPEYIQGAVDEGVLQPVGMCLQDAGWMEGPWLRKDTSSIYTTWSHYFKDVITARDFMDWNLSQEDIKVSLVWGGQILQKVAQAVRKTENVLTNQESVLALNHLFLGQSWPQNTLDIAWENLLLAQHHDCWIVPYNKKHGRTWQQHVTSWTDNALQAVDSVLQTGLEKPIPVEREKPGQDYIRVYNSAGLQREELVHIKIPQQYAKKSIRLLDENGQEIMVQQNEDQIHFYANVPPLGYKTYQIKVGKTIKTVSQGMAKKLQDGHLLIESDRYRINFDPTKGGIVTSLQLKEADNREFVDQAKGGLNELRGYFFEEHKFRSSRETPAELTIIEDGKLFTRIRVKGNIAGSPFEQIVQVDKKGRMITTKLHIDWQGHPGIGQFDENGRFKNENLEKAFYNSGYKLITLFPVRLDNGIIHKDAPFDILKSQLQNTFYDRWDHIKNDVLLHWTDLSSSDGKAGFTLFSDETTTYAHGPDLPLGLTTQYSGKGLFGADYSIDGPTNMRYAVLPHAGDWESAKVSQASEYFNKPLLGVCFSAAAIKAQDWDKSFLRLDPHAGWEVTAFKVDDSDGSLLLRIWNATGNDQEFPLRLNQPIKAATVIELNGQVSQDLKPSQDGKKFELSIPAKGIRTIRLKGWQSS